MSQRLLSCTQQFFAIENTLNSYLVSKVPSYLVRLHLTYQNSGETRLANLIKSCRYAVIEDTSYNNWNGGTCLHDVVLFAPLTVISTIALDEIAQVTSRICEDLGKLAHGVENEGFHAVRLNLDDEKDPDCQRATRFSAKLPMNPNSVEFWKPAYARIFISHRDAHKRDARLLGNALEGFGLSCFVAHDTIVPRSEWRTEIMKGLETMEIMLVFLTDDFEQSPWCQQEVGYALGKSIPIISIKFGHRDPPGFISNFQAFRGSTENIALTARGLFPFIDEALGKPERLVDILISKLIESPNWSESKERFERLESVVTKLTDAQVAILLEGFRINDQLHDAYYLTSSDRFNRFLKNVTGESFVRRGAIIKKVTLDDLRQPETK